jgi:cAMP-dependent protein kinase regulator
MSSEIEEIYSELEQKVKPLLNKLVNNIITDKPDNVPLYMINFLQKEGGLTSTGLTYDEKKELNRLRREVNEFREREEIEKKKKEENSDSASVSSSESSSEEEDDFHEEEELKFKKRLEQKRNEKKMRTSVSAEVYGNFNKKENFKPRFIKKTPDQIIRIKNKVLSSFLFSSLDKKDLDIVIGAMDERKLKPNEIAIQQGDDGDVLYIVETGELECSKHFTKDGPEVFLKMYEPGDSFGELALLYNAPRAATIKAKTDCILWALDRATFNNIVKDAAQKKREKFESFLKKVDILSTIDSYELTQICDALKETTYLKGDYIIKENDYGDIFYILEEGNCRATKTLEPGKPATEIKKYSIGEYFGERSLIKGEPRYANIEVTSDICKVLSLDRNSFKRLLGPIEKLLERNIEKYQKFVVKK